MSSLDQSICQQLRNLAAQLTNKKTYKAVSNEITKILAAFGVPAEQFLLNLLLGSLDLNDQRTAAGMKDQFKVQFLNQELSNLSSKPEFLNYFSSVLPATTIRETFAKMVQVLRFSLPVQLLIALSLSLSNQPLTADSGRDILAAKLLEYFNQGRPQRIPEYALHLILTLLKEQNFGNRANMSQEVLADVYSFLIDSNPLDHNQIEFLPLVKNTTQLYNLPIERTRFLTTFPGDPKLSQILSDLGPSCSQTPNQLREVFGLFNNAVEDDMVEMIIVICSKQTDTQDFEARVIGSVFSGIQREEWNVLNRVISDKKGSTQWNMEVIGRVVKEFYGGLDWDKVIDLLDHPKFVIKNQNAFMLLTSLYHKITNKTFPILPFFKDWKNPRGQVSFLCHAVYSMQPSYIFTFENSPHRAPINEITWLPECEHKIMALSSIELLQTLIELSVTEFYTTVRNLLINEAKEFPDILIICLAMVQPRQGLALHEEMLDMLMPTYIQPQTTNGIVLQTIWEYNPSLITRAAVEFYEREPNTITLSHLLDLTQEIKDSLPILAACDAHHFTVHFGLLASKRDFLHLDQWMRERVKHARDDFVRTLVNFMKSQVARPLREGLMDIEGVLDKAQFTKESLIIIFDNLVNSTVTQNCLTNDTQSEIVSLYKQICELIPDIKSPQPNNNQVEDAADKYFQQLYREQISIEDTVNLMLRFKESANSFEHEVFNCMVNNLFDEFRFFHKYPERELKITGELYGAIIQNDLLAGITLGIALKQVLQSLKRPYGKLYRFGWYALQNFTQKLPRWKQYSNNLLNTETLRAEQPDFIQRLEAEIETAITDPDEPLVEDAGFQDTQSSDLPASPIPQQVPDPEPADIETTIDESVQDRIKFILNRTSPNNVEEKAEELKEVIVTNGTNAIAWFANYLVIERAPLETNFHGLYLVLLTKMQMAEVIKFVTKESYVTVRRILSSKDLLEEKQKVVLKALGSWVGSITLARNKPILIKYLDIKELIIQAYEQGKLFAIIPFTCKIMEKCKESVVFSTENPWVCAILQLMVELMDKSDLAISLQIPIALTFKQLELDTTNYPRSNILTTREIKVRSPDFTMRDPIPQEEDLTDAPPSIERLPEFVVISPKIIENFPEAEMRRLVAGAVETAVRQIIQPIVARSVNIAILTTRELSLKDFALEKDHEKLERASKCMVKALAGSLAIVTGKEPFRVELLKQLSELLSQKTTLNAANIKMIVEQASIDNFEIGSGLVARTVIEKALKDLQSDQILADAINKRKSFGDKFFDENSIEKTRLTSFLPAKLKPSADGLTAEQFQVYQDFPNVLDRPKRSLTPPLQSELYSEANKLPTKDAISQFDTELVNTEQLYRMKQDLRLSETRNSIEILISKAITSVLPSETILFCSYKLFKKMFVFEQMIPLYANILAGFKEQYKNIQNQLTSWLMHIENPPFFNVPVTIELIREKLLNTYKFDKHLSRGIDLDDISAMHVGRALVQKLMIDSNILTKEEVKSSIPSLKAYLQRHPHELELQQYLNAMSIIAPNKGQLTNQSQRVKDILQARFSDWLNMTLSGPFINSENIPAFIKSLENANLISTKEQLSFFFDVLIQEAIKQCNARENNYGSIDSFVKLARILMLITKLHQPLVTLKRFLGSVVQNILTSFLQPDFNQRVYFRILSDLIIEVCQPTITFPQVTDLKEQIIPIAEALYKINPCIVPAFTMSWLELISLRFFLPKILSFESNTYGNIHWNKMFEIVMAMLKFLQVHLNETPLSYGIGQYYEGVLRIVGLLCNDFPDFICMYYPDFIDFVPDICIQLKNMLQSACPNGMVPPNPFTRNLKVDRIPQINQQPVFVINSLSKLQASGIKTNIDAYLSNKTQNLINAIVNELQQNSYHKQVQLTNAMILYITCKYCETKQRDSNEVFLSLLTAFDNEGRQIFINGIVNHLRYPSTHTKLLSRVCLYSFLESRQIVQEQITRALTERLLSIQPHPWGVLITFIELIRNPRYELMKKPFIRSSPDVEQFFEEFMKSYMQGSTS